MEPNKYNFDSVVDRRGTDATKYEELAEKYGRTDLLPLWIADMDFPVCDEIIDSMRRRLDHPVLGYTFAPAEFWGSITGWLQQRHGWTVHREEIDYVPGVKKGLGLCVNYFTAPGDRVVIQPPVYHSFRSVVAGNGRVPVDNPLLRNADGTYSMDFDGLRSVIAEHRPKMMIVCNPQNPVGIQWPAEVLAEVAHICHEAGMVLLSDEIYGDLTLGGRPHIPTASVSDEAAAVTVTLGAPSKSFNIPGLASAWTVVKNPELRRGFFEWLLASEFDTPPLMAVTATRAAYENGEAWLDAVLDYLDANARFAMDYIERHMPGVTAVAPEAGFGLWVNFNGLGLTPEGLTDLLVNKAGVALSDGNSFGAGGEGFVRLNIGVARPLLAEALKKIADAIG